MSEDGTVATAVFEDIPRSATRGFESVCSIFRSRPGNRLGR